MTDAEKAALAAEIRAEAWKRGKLRYKFHGNQITLYDKLEKGQRMFFANWSRRTGKSFFGIIRALETAIRVPGCRVLYLAPNAKMAAQIVTDQLPGILHDCPAELKPTIDGQKNDLKFKNGSLIRFRGVNSETSETLRGGETHLVVLDEAGFMDRLSSVVREIVRPMTATVKGTILILTTPPNVPQHDSQILYDRLVEEGAAYDVTLAESQNPRLDYEERALMLSDAGEHPEDIPLILRGEIPPKTRAAQREYFCQWVSDAGKLVMPEYAELGRDLYRQPPEPPIYRDCYTAADWGVVDPTALLFSYWDIDLNCLVIEDEWTGKGESAGTPAIAAAIHQKEHELWRGAHDILRVSDIDLRLIRDLAELHRLRFVQANKKDREANIELARSYLRRKQVIIHPRCKKLNRQLLNAVHNTKGNDFARNRAKEGDIIHPDHDNGHFDLVAAFIYLVRFVHTRRKVDPTPRNADLLNRGADSHVSMKHPSRNPNGTGALAALNVTPLQRRLARQGKRR